MKLEFHKNILVLFVAAFILSAVIIISNGFTTSPTRAQTDVCLSCHEDKDLYAEKNGKKVSLFVSPELYKKSVHSGAECNDCHESYNPEDLPHNKNKKGVNCNSCHSDLKGIESSVHAKVRCFDCHTKHYIKPATEFKIEQTSACLSCHNTKNIMGYKTSLHAKKNIGCDGCHAGGHGTQKVNKSEAEENCKKCHKKEHKGFDNTVHNSVLGKENKKAPSCVDCHGAHQILSTKLSIESSSCLKCHLDEKMFPGESKGSAKFVREYKSSIHGMLTDKNGREAAGCVDCHGSHGPNGKDDTKMSLKMASMIETCGKCHQTEVSDFKKSAHGKGFLNNDKNAPTCTICHGEHSIQSVLKSDKLAKINQADMCLGCHKETKLPDKNYKGEEELVSHYEKSGHYIALKKGNLNAASCTDCHGAHKMEKANNPNARVNKKNLENTCGQSGCHEQQLADFTGSVHEIAITEKNNLDAPSCTGCHGNHVILKSKDINNRISSSRGVIQLCSDCHSSVEMNKKFNLPSQVTETYNESFHGLATRGGSKEAANCESCHGHHKIRPSSDTLSTINKKNLPVTCGKCHPGATSTLFKTKIHLTDAETDSAWAYWIKRFYISMIFGLIGFMLLHNVLDFVKKKKARKAKGGRA